MLDVLFLTISSTDTSLSFFSFIQIVRPGECVLGIWPNPLLRRIFYIFLICIEFILPLLILLICYGRIIWILTRRIDSNFNKSGNQSDTFQLARTNTLKTFMIVALAFIICWSNNQVYYLMYNLGYRLDWTSTYYKFTVLMAFLNCTINPFIYLIKYQDFQMALKTLFCCDSQNTRNDSETQFSNSGTTRISSI